MEKGMNFIRLSKHYFTLKGGKEYDFTRRGKRGYDAARKAFERMLENETFDVVVMADALTAYELEDSVTLQQGVAAFKEKYGV
jgi:hypothetical protein